MSEPTGASETHRGDELLAQLADDFLRRHRAGEHPSMDEYAAKHPDLAGRIRELFPTMLAMEQTGTGATVNPAPITERVGATIGRYKLLERIGEGGFGVVYMAEQQLPVRRKVALKVLKPGMDTRQVLARFEAERQALAIMDHPNIAKVFDGGMTDSGRPYFVMELVKGVPITDFCDQHHLTPRQRLELFAQVCHAVQHAHQKGIIHRDIKPTNVMVIMQDTTPLVKVIDFGVAKALGQELTDKTMFTGFAQLVGTPLYMSPEQAGQSALDVDTRSDIYSLGVLLYELLTGTTPFDKERFKTAAQDEIRRIIREEEPPTPSTRLSESNDSLASISAQRQTEPAKLTRLVRGELDWIVMKALEKDRNRRYETANGFAMDVQRYLADEPVLACPPSATYRLRKFARRNKRTLITSALLGAMLLVVAGSFGWMARDRAAQRGRTAEAVSVLLDQCEDAMRADQVDRAALALGAAQRRAGDGGAEHLSTRLAHCQADVALLRALDAADTFRWTWTAGENRFPDPQAVVAQWRAALAAYGLNPDTSSTGEAARRVNQSLVRDRVLTALDLCAVFDRSAGALAILRSADPDPYRDAFRDAVASKDLPKAVAIFAQPQALAQPARFAAVLGQTPGLPTDRQRAVLENALRTRKGDLSLLMALGHSYPLQQSEGATQRLRWYQAAVAAHPTNTAAQNALGIALMDHGDLDAAASTFRELIELDVKSSPALGNLGTVLHKKGDSDGAITAFRRAVQLEPNEALWHMNLANVLAIKADYAAAIDEYTEVIRLEPNNGDAHNNRGKSLHDSGRSDEAIAAFQEAVRVHPNDAGFRSNLANGLSAKGMLDEAIAAHREAVRLDPNNAEVRNNLGYDLAAKGELDGAIAEYREAIRLAPEFVHARSNLASALRKKGDVDAAIAEFKETIRLDPNIAPPWLGLGRALVTKGDVEGAAAAFREAIRLDPWRSAAALSELGQLLGRKGDAAGALTRFREAVRLDPTSAAAHTNLGIGLHESGDLDGAIAEHREAIRLDPNYAIAYNNLARAHQAKGDFDGAVASMREALRLDPTNAQFRGGLGAILWDHGDSDGALAELREVIRLEPNGANSQSNLGFMLQAKGDLSGALSAYRAAVNLNPKNAYAYNSLGWLLATGPDGLRDAKQAVEHAFRACELTAWKEPNYFDTLAAAYAEAGDFDKAVEFEQRALASPAFEKADGTAAKQRLELYLQKKPYREPALARDASTRPVQ